MNEDVTINKKALAELFDFIYQQGYQQALEILTSLKKTSGLTKEMKEELIKKL